MKKLIPHKFTISFYIGVKEIIYYTLMAKNNSAENIVLDLVVIPFDQIKNHVILDTFLPISENKDEIIKILKQELFKSLFD